MPPLLNKLMEFRPPDKDGKYLEYLAKCYILPTDY